MPYFNRNWKPETWSRKQESAHKMVEQIKKSLPFDWCAWWHETDPFTHMSSRVWRDFQTEAEASIFAVKNKYQPTYFAHIKTLPWHP